jgi:hypothetical protein
MHRSYLYVSRSAASQSRCRWLIALGKRRPQALSRVAEA